MQHVGGQPPRDTRRPPRSQHVSEAIGRLLFIDASLNKRLAGELRHRGRAARSASQEHLHRRVADDALLRAVRERFEDAVLVTGDDQMPEEWAAVIAELGSTIATIVPFDTRLPAAAPYLDEDAWERDSVHRWAHRMQQQPAGSAWRYSPGAARLWKPR